MNTVIKVENLSKKYLIGHQRQGRYLTLRDTLAQTARDLGKRLVYPFRASIGQPRGGLSTTEEFWALKDVSFEVKQGDRVGIIGRNGAGKSTLLKLLSRITEPTSGRITIDGRVASLLEVGTGFHPELTGRENIFLNGAVLGMARAEIRKKFDEIVAFAEVEKFLDTPVKRYSSGMYVRLAFAVAAHLEPEILIVDEVLAVGDAQFQKKCLGKMAEVSQSDRTVIFVSHNMAAIQYLCKQGILLENGRAIKNSQVEDVIEAYIRCLDEKMEGQDGLVSTNDEMGLVLKEFRLRDGSGRVVNSLQTGAAGGFSYVLESRNDLKNIHCMVSVDATDFTRVCVYHSRISGQAMAMDRPGGEVTCKFNRCPLVPGHYSLSVKVVIEGQVAFWLPQQFRMNVESGDFFGTGQLPAEWGGKILVDHVWQCQQTSKN